MTEDWRHRYNHHARIDRWPACRLRSGTITVNLYFWVT
jgi:hypothetical protein